VVVASTKFRPIYSIYGYVPCATSVSEPGEGAVPKKKLGRMW
jgi:hypothetical protein